MAGVVALSAVVSPLRVAVAEQPVYVIAIREDITHNTLFLVRRGLQEAAAKRAALVVLDMETNGGRVDVTEDIIRLLERAPMPTVTYVNVKAYSAGAFIAAATDQIFMAPGSVIGAATPVMLIPGQGIQELPKSYEEKITSAMRALIRSAAQQKGHNADVFEAMVDADREVVIDGAVINPKGKLLTLTNEEAARMYGDPPKRLLSAGTVRTLEELIQQIGPAGVRVVRIEPYGFEVLGRWITAIAPLLILIGFVAIYIEMKTPGIGVPALVAAICFGIYFFGTFAAGLAGWEEVVLFVVGVALLIVELFVLPGFGVVGFLGLCAILAALMLALTQRWPGGPVWPSWPEFQVPVVKVLLSFVGSLVVMALLGRWLPKTALFRRLELGRELSAAAGYTASRGEARSLLGQEGLAETVLRPAGKGRFGDRLVDVVTEGDYVEKGEPIKIIAVDGSRVVVSRWTSKSS